MPKYEFCIATYNKPNGSNGELRHDEGDIINIQPIGAELGRMSLDYYLIVPIDISVPINTDLLKPRLCTRSYDDGSIENKDWRDIEYEVDDLDPVEYPFKQFVWSLGGIPGPRMKPSLIAKFRHKINLSNLGDIDLAKTRDPKVIYQPFLSESRLIALKCFASPDSDYHIKKQDNVYLTWKSHEKRRNIHTEVIKGQTIRYIRRNEPIIRDPILNPVEYEIDCTTKTIKKDEEKFWPVLNLIQDKFDDSYIDPGVITSG